MMTIETRSIDYDLNGGAHEGLLAIDSSNASARPVVLISHAWGGRGDVEDGYAKKLAALGYAGFALDLYGKGKRGETTEECQALMTPFMEDRAMLQERLLSTIDYVAGLPEVDENNIAIMGFCFGGLCALDVARSGRAIKGAASFHGLFAPNGLDASGDIKAKVIAFHGWDDPMATPDDVKALAEEMTARNADWQLHGYGGTMHAFTNPAANDPDFGTVYNETAANRAWAAMENFLAEIFR